jgi:hypothetical protein
MLDSEDVKVIDLLGDLIIKDPFVSLSIGSVMSVSVNPAELAIASTLPKSEGQQT